MKNYIFYFYILIPLLILPRISHAQKDTVSYSVLMNENVVGYFKEWQLESNAWLAKYQINDRGRGDSLEIYWRENEDGFLTELLVTGVDYLKAPVEENFSWNGKTASWKNNTENESVVATEPAFYIGLHGSGGRIEKTLLKNDNKIKLFPSGEASIEIISNHAFPHNDSTIELDLYRRTGLGLTPTYGWVDKDQDFFATAGNWSSIIREGFESLIPSLLEIQSEKVNDFYMDLANQNVLSPDQILIKNVDLIDVEKKQVQNSQNVFIADGLIKEISTSEIKIKGDHYVIDGTGLMLSPGLIDMHVHISAAQSGLQHIANGVTSVRDLGNSFAILDLRDQINNNEIIGPEIEHISGLIDGRGEFAGPTPALAGDLDEAIRWVDSFGTRGYDQIKIYSSIKPEWVPKIVERTKSHGMRVSGHIPAYMTAEQAIEIGYDEIQHMNMIFLNFFGDTIDTRTPLRFSIPGERAASLDLESKEVTDFIALLKNKGIVVDPTLHAFEGLLTSRQGKLDKAYESILDRMPINLQRYLNAGGGGLPVTEETDALYIESYNAFLKMTKLLYDSGVSIVMGTDAWAGFSMHREMELYVDAGIDEFDVLQIATLAAAEVLGKEKTIGSIAAGKKANLILIDGNPINNISDIRNVKTVFKNGSIYDAVSLLNAISIKPYNQN